MAAAASYAPRSSAYRKIRVAVLGTGHAHAFGKIHTLRSLPEYEFVGICRPDPDEPNEGDVFRGVRWLSMEELLDESTAIELVDVESAVQHNLQYARKCVSAGKFVHQASSLVLAAIAGRFVFPAVQARSQATQQI